MIWQDAVNALCEFLGGILMWYSVRKLYKDKQVRGVSLIAAGFFTTWSLWNLYYYPHLNQWLSFLAGINLSIANIIWIIMAVYYTKKYENRINR